MKITALELAIALIITGIWGAARIPGIALSIKLGQAGINPLIATFISFVAPAALFLIGCYAAKTKMAQAH